jgi:methylglutaconyl-CoA hydratase
MPNPIADPLVEGVDTDAQSGLVLIEATPDGVATVTINRPEHRNAFNAEVIAALREAFETLEGADGVRVIFVNGAGGTFSIGADLEWVRDTADYPEADIREDAMAMARMLKDLHDLPILTVALVEGGAEGSGAGLAAACDMAIATSDARFAFPEVKLGLVAATISPYVAAAVGSRRARSLFALGRSFDAWDAHRYGLVDLVVEGPEGLAAAREAIVDEIMGCGPEAVAESKRLVDHVARHAVDHGIMTDTAHWAARVRVGPEGEEGAKAFLEGRPPGWARGADDGADDNDQSSPA